MKNLKIFGTGGTIVTFIIVGLSGVGMFFGIKQGWIKSIHEYIGLAMVAIALVHIYVNWRPFLSYLKGTKGTGIVALIAICGGIWVYSLGLEKQTNWKKGAAYEKMVKVDINTFIDTFGGNKEAFAKFLTDRGIEAPNNITLKEFAKQNNLKENEIFDILFK